MTYTVLVHRELAEEGNGYWAEVPELPGCMTSGETLEEIRVSIVEAIATWFAVKEAAGDDLPVPVDFKFEIEVPQRVNASA